MFSLQISPSRNYHDRLVLGKGQRDIPKCSKENGFFPVGGSGLSRFTDTANRETRHGP